MSRRARTDVFGYDGVSWEISAHVSTERKTRPKVRFCLVFERELLSVPVMRRVLGDTLREIGVSEDCLADILLAATEACTNVVLHAGRSAPAYTVAATVDRAGCRVEVTDAGGGCYLPGGRLPVPPDVRPGGPDGENRHRTGPAATDEGLGGDPVPHGVRPGGQAGDEKFPPLLAESGRGIAIMEACVDEVTLRSAPGQGTRVVLDKRLQWEGPRLRVA